MLKGPKAFQLGLADVMFEPADFLEESLLWTARVLTGEVVGRADGRSSGTRRPGTAPLRRPASRWRPGCTARRRRRTALWT